MARWGCLGLGGFGRICLVRVGGVILGLVCARLGWLARPLGFGGLATFAWGAGAVRRVGLCAVEGLAGKAGQGRVGMS